MKCIKISAFRLSFSGERYNQNIKCNPEILNIEHFSSAAIIKANL